MVGGGAKISWALGRKIPKYGPDYVCIAVLTLDARLLARSQYPEGPATGHLDTGFSWFPSLQVATSCLSCSPPDLNFLVTFFFIFAYM